MKCFWCRQEGEWRAVIDPYDAAYGLEEETVPMCPYCYAYRCVVAVRAELYDDNLKPRLHRISQPL